MAFPRLWRLNLRLLVTATHELYDKELQMLVTCSFNHLIRQFTKIGVQSYQFCSIHMGHQAVIEIEILIN